MGVKGLNRNEPHIARNNVVGAPPSFNDQVQIKAFKRDINFLRNIKNKVSTLLNVRKTKNKQLAGYNIKKISTIEKQEYMQELMDEYEPITADEVNKNQLFKLDSVTKKDILKRIKDKGFSASQAKNIFNTEFKKFNSYEEVNKALVDIPSVDIYKMGFSSEAKMHKYLEDKVTYLVRLGYNDKQSKLTVINAFNQATTKKEFDNYLNSIPTYEDYNKEYSSVKDVHTIKKNAIKHLLKQGYSKDDAEDIVEEHYTTAETKDDFLHEIKEISKPAIRFKGYDTTKDYLKLQTSCIDRLKVHLGYSHKKAAKIAKEYQENSPSRTEFMFKINSIHAPIR